MGVDVVQMVPTRRQVVTAALTMAGAWGAGTGLCGRTGGVALAAARTTRGSAAPIVLSFLPSQSWPTAIGPTLWQVLYAGLAPFLARHRGIAIRLFANQGYQGATQAAMLAGAGPDVFSDWVLPPFVQNGLMLDLGPYLRRDHMDLGVFPSGQVSFFRQAGQFSPVQPDGLFAVPAYLHTEAYALNLTVLDGMGLPHPEPDWTVAQWTRLWEAVTIKPGRGRKRRFGTDLDDGGYGYGYNMITPYRLWGYGGEYVDPQDATRCYLASPGSLACGRARFQLLWDGVATLSGAASAFAAGRLVSTHHTCTCGSQVLEAEQWTDFHWDYFADPVWPARRASYASSDFYGIWSGTRHAEAAWLFLRWLAFGADWQRLLMRTALAGPNQARLWEEWTRVVRAFAPPLQYKNLNAFAVPVERDDPYFGRAFRYSGDAVQAVIQRYAPLLNGQQLTVDAAFREMAQQIDAVQRAGAAAAPGVALAATRYRDEVAAARVARSDGRAWRFPAPPRTGLGTPAVAAPQLAWINRTSGSVTLIGEGGGVAGDSDSMTFACVANVASQGRFVCRLGLIAADQGTGLAAGAKIGLMARSDLSDMAAEVGIEVAMGRGVHMHTRAFPGTSLGDHRPPSPTARTGLIGQDVILRNAATAARNYLLRPVWLRLDFVIDRWLAYTSLDGSAWTQAFAPVGMGFVGCWVGVYATAHGGNNVLARFGQLAGFRPDTFVTVGVSLGA